ncbi:MAG: hypothetical protein NVS4B10_01320 [Myxococcales bacterium]
MLGVDPVDDCTFWFTSEYLSVDGTFNWHTRVGSFKFPNCAPVPTPDFSLSTSPTSQTITPGASTSYTVTVTPSGGFTGSTLSVTTSTTTPTGSYPLTITGTSGTLSRTTSVTLVVNAPPPPPPCTDGACP